MSTRMSTARSLRLGLLTVAVASVFVLAFVPRVDAGVFTINACQADRAGYATAAFDDRATHLDERAKRDLGSPCRDAQVLRCRQSHRVTHSRKLRYAYCCNHRPILVRMSRLHKRYTSAHPIVGPVLVLAELL